MTFFGVVIQYHRQPKWIGRWRTQAPSLIRVWFKGKHVGRYPRL